FSYRIGEDGVETFVTTPEVTSENTIDEDPLPPGQVWCINNGSQDEASGLYKIEVTIGRGRGVKILNIPAPQPFKESVKYAEQNLYSKTQSLVGDRNPTDHEFSIQLRSFSSARSGAGTGMAALIAMATALLEKNTRGGLVIVGQLN